MMNGTVHAIPLACVPDAIPAAERAAHFRLGQALFRGECQARRDTEAGYVFRFPSSSFEQLARFIVNERKCCPFLRIELSSEPEEGAVWLRLTGPEGTREFLAAELGRRGCGCR
jgi:hypothetical protein